MEEDIDRTEYYEADLDFFQVEERGKLGFIAQQFEAVRLLTKAKPVKEDMRLYGDALKRRFTLLADNLIFMSTQSQGYFSRELLTSVIRRRNTLIQRNLWPDYTGLADFFSPSREKALGESIGRLQKAYDAVAWDRKFIIERHEHENFPDLYQERSAIIPALQKALSRIKEYADKMTQFKGRPEADIFLSAAAGNMCAMYKLNRRLYKRSDPDSEYVRFGKQINIGSVPFCANVVECDPAVIWGFIQKRAPALESYLKNMLPAVPGSPSAAGCQPK